LDDVASELIVHCGHSTRETPQTIEEVRRILLENWRDYGHFNHYTGRRRRPPPEIKPGF
jgi:hypothetical protein